MNDNNRLPHISNPLEIVHLPRRMSDVQAQIAEHVLTGRIGEIVLIVFDADNRRSVHTMAVTTYADHVEKLAAEGAQCINLVVGGSDITLYQRLP
jgi:hypothetical protein